MGVELGGGRGGAGLERAPEANGTIRHPISRRVWGCSGEELYLPTDHFRFWG